MIDIDISQEGRKVNLFADKHIIEAPVALHSLSKIDSKIGGLGYGRLDERYSKMQGGERGVAERGCVERMEPQAVAFPPLPPPHPPRLLVRDYVTQHDYSVRGGGGGGKVGGGEECIAVPGRGISELLVYLSRVSRLDYYTRKRYQKSDFVSASDMGAWVICMLYEHQKMP